MIISKPCVPLWFWGVTFARKTRYSEPSVRVADSLYPRLCVYLVQYIISCTHLSCSQESDLSSSGKFGLQLTALLLAAILAIPMACLIGARSADALVTPPHSGCHERTDSAPAPISPDGGNKSPHQRCCRSAQPAQMVAMTGSPGHDSLNVDFVIAAPAIPSQEQPARSTDPGRSGTPPGFQILRV
jgi:hypothetical protein